MSYVISARFDLLVESVLVLIPEGRISNQENVEDHTCNTQKDKDEHGRTDLGDPVVMAVRLVTQLDCHRRSALSS